MGWQHRSIRGHELAVRQALVQQQAVQGVCRQRLELEQRRVHYLGAGGLKRRSRWLERFHAPLASLRIGRHLHQGSHRFPCCASAPSCRRGSPAQAPSARDRFLQPKAQRWGSTEGLAQNPTNKFVAPHAMAVPTTFLVALMALLSFQSPVYGIRQQAGAELGGGGSGGSGSGGGLSAYPALRFRDDQTFKILQVLSTVTRSGMAQALALPKTPVSSTEASCLRHLLASPMQLTDLHYGEDLRLDAKSDQASRCAEAARVLPQNQWGI